MFGSADQGAEFILEPVFLMRLSDEVEHGQAFFALCPWNLGTYNNVQANTESHATNTQMGPFRFTSVSYKNSSGVWTVNDTAPTAERPYSVSKTSNANFRVYGP
ncbi:hypothetical protein DET56_101101 [Paenibacillus pabuli]|uniref:Uncharacterized protein n=1 Tax=Paenibacillus pabuli TaxID=1472 RepID=A0A855Y603_9BACL|nr:hypothetical protein DET56_101101 [Paenibacillus pabuli]PXW11237.1 hypothetical protein DEU73_101100 [Paenibacillus taichungensis]